MANIINSQLLVDNNKRSLVKITMEFDTDEANTVLIDASALAYALNASGQIMTSGADPKGNYRTSIKRIFGNTKTDGHIKLQWEGDTNSDIVILTDGNFDYNFESSGDSAVITNPEANATGNILYSIVEAGTDDVMTLFIDLRKNSRDYDAGQTADPTAFNRR
jgi:hypothetical protein